MKNLILALMVGVPGAAFAGSLTTVMIHGSVASESASDDADNSHEALVKGSVISSRGEDPDRVRASLAKGVHVLSRELKPCQDAFITLRADAGLFNNGEAKETSVVSFACADVASATQDSVAN